MQGLLRGIVIVALVLFAAFVVGVQLPTTQTEATPLAVKHEPARRRSPVHTDHTGMMAGPFPDGPSVTRACLECHAKAGKEVLGTRHFKWLGEPSNVPGAGGPGHIGSIAIGKKNVLNNFCLSIESNWPRCTSCHAGYGWTDAKFDFERVDAIDCLVCHEQTGTYRKGLGGLPEKDVDLVRVAASVGTPTRDNCGTCHFSGGGGDAVKHGDLDGTLFFPREHIDLHMGRANFQCIDCHRSEGHHIAGQSISVSVGKTSGSSRGSGSVGVGGGSHRVACEDCHPSEPHRSVQLNLHSASVACETCHIPEMAIDTPTKLIWDWSTAGRDVAVKDPHRYLKEKGSFVYASRVRPEYRWFNGTAERYLKGDTLDPKRVVRLNRPLGDIEDRSAKIWPFKIHRGKQPYDTQHLHLLIAQTYGEGGFWESYDWDRALRLGASASGVPYSGQYDFVSTEMYWPLAHMVQPGDRALQCTDCHSSNSSRGRLDWAALGFEGDPAFRGSPRRRIIAEVTRP